MRRTSIFFKKGTVAPLALGASVFIGLIAILGITVIPIEIKPTTDIRIEPTNKAVVVHEIFEIEVIVESSVPVNVFAGELHFNPDVLMVKSIDYNTSIADLWAVLPWYSNGDGTLNFGGGTTLKNGFQGTDTLIKVTFETLREGEGIISMNTPRVLLHNGLGTDAQLPKPIDAILTVRKAFSDEENLVIMSTKGTSYTVAQKIPSTDLNGDGKQSIADISIFMLNIAGNNSRYDFNLDGQVDLKDLNILLGGK